MAAPGEVVRLVEQFERNREAYRSARYNETQLRRQFLDPLFEVLGLRCFGRVTQGIDGEGSARRACTRG